MFVARSVRGNVGVNVIFGLLLESRCDSGLSFQGNAQQCKRVAQYIVSTASTCMYTLYVRVCVCLNVCKCVILARASVLIFVCVNLCNMRACAYAEMCRCVLYARVST